MKFLVNTIKLVALIVAVFVLANCASGPTEVEKSSQIERSEVQVEEKIKTAESVPRKNITVSGVRTADVAGESENQRNSTVQVSPVTALLKPLLEQVKIDWKSSATSKRMRESEFIQLRSELSLSTQEKDELFGLISRFPEQSGQIFKYYRVNPTIQTKDNPLSTFAMDVDNGSFKLAAAMLNKNQMPNPTGIRVEEFINAFDYQYTQSNQLFSLSAEAMPSPFRQGFHLLHVGAQTQNLNQDERNPSNIVLVADVSGSMESDNKIELLKVAMKTLVSQLGKHDQVALVAYNDDAKVLLNSTRATKKRKIYRAIERLQASGSTNVEAGLKTAYKLANDMYQPGFNNRVVLTSDGMANSGSRSPEAILATITHAKQKGIFLTTLGVGTEVYNDYLLEQLANKGNGSYLYIADLDDIQQTFVDNINSQLQTVAKDAKIQVNFDPKIVSHYRLLGYENRHLEQQDFLDADKDGAEIGAGQKVTAIYEVKLVNEAYRDNNAFANVAVAYKKPEGKKVFQIQKTIPTSIIKDDVDLASSDSLLSFSIAAFAEKLRQSYWARFYSYQDIESLILKLPRQYQKHQQVKELKQLIALAEQLDSGHDLFEERHPISQVNFDRVPLLD